MLIRRTGGHPLTLAVAILAGLAYCHRPLRRLQPALTELSPVDRARSVALVPLIRLIGDVAKMVGYPIGLLWRLRHRPG